MTKPWEDENYNAEAYYDEIRRMVFARQCWACGRGEYDQPELWYAPWLIERSHIVSKPRRCDRRAIVMLCSLCHKISHGERFAGHPQPKLERSHLVFLKVAIDPEWFDLGFLQANHVGKVPDAEPLPEFYSYSRQTR